MNNFMTLWSKLHFFTRTAVECDSQKPDSYNSKQKFYFILKNIEITFLLFKDICVILVFPLWIMIYSIHFTYSAVSHQPPMIINRWNIYWIFCKSYRQSTVTYINTIRYYIRRQLKSPIPKHSGAVTPSCAMLRFHEALRAISITTFARMPASWLRDAVLQSIFLSEPLRCAIKLRECTFLMRSKRLTRLQNEISNE